MISDGYSERSMVATPLVSCLIFARLLDCRGKSRLQLLPYSLEKVSHVWTLEMGHD